MASPRRKTRSHGREKPAATPVRDAEFIVSASNAGAWLSLDRAIRTELGASWESARRLIRTGKATVNGAVVTDPTMHVAAFAKIAIRMAAPRPPPALPVERTDLVYV